jgi:hypothetical protein
MKPEVHAVSSAKKFGGKASDYLEIHEFLDSSKSVVSDHRHRALTHNTWFIMYVLPRVFGNSIKNSKGKLVSVRDIGEQHIFEDFRSKFIPSAQDWLMAMEYQNWMNNGDGVSPSEASRKSSKIVKEKPFTDLEDLFKQQNPKPYIPHTPKFPGNDQMID